MIDFPASPTLGQQFTAAGVTWTWDGAKWTASGLGLAYLPLAGGTMLGPLVLAADPTAPLQAATAQYADKPRYGDNRLINGDMRIDTRNNGASGTASGYTIDRWRYDGAQPSKGTWSRAPAAASLIALGYGYSFQFISSSTYAVVTADYFNINQVIEADMVSDFAWGTANAQPVTISFWAFSTLTGTFGGSIRNAAVNRSYPFTYSIPAANTWTKIVLTIPGDTGGTWVMSGNTAALTVNFGLGTGATYSGPAGVWGSANYLSATGAVSIVGTNGATFNITGVKLEIGSVVTPFNRQSLAKSLADCQRYYQVFSNVLVAGFGTAGVGIYVSFPLPVAMRATPTAVLGTVSGPGNSSTFGIGVSGIDSVYFTMVVTASGSATFRATPTFSAEL